MRYLLIVLLALLPGLALASDGYGPPADRPWAQMRAVDGGHVLTWEVSDDADAWRITVDGAEVFTALYIHPGELVDVPLTPEQWTPGEEIRICATWDLRGGAVTECHALARPFVVWLVAVHH